MINEITALVALLLLSGFFSSAETALFSISKARARHMAKSQIKSCRLIKTMKDDPHRLLTTILIGNNLVNVGASALATSIAIKMVTNNAVGIATGVMTFLILVFGEVFPKSLATRNNVLIAKMIILPLYWLSILFFPITLFLNFIPKLTYKIKKTPSFTEEELMTLVEAVEEEGEIKKEEKKLIHKIFEFDDINASEIMTPRGDMFTIDIDQEIHFDAIGKSGFTRIPVIKGDLDHVIGIINVKDIFLHLAISQTKPDIKRIMREPYFIPENKKLDNLLHQFKKRKQHIAIVVDEHGGVAGLITLEDVLEELVGEISDETDIIEHHIIRVKDNEWIVLGKADIEGVNEKIGMEIPESKEYDTFSGYVLYKIERIPKEMEQINIGNFIITVKEMEGNRIKKYSVKQTSTQLKT
ncbi:MAG TPA: hemolysin family protein [Flexilinea sp.]|nr:hemolysin family protein [Flexilinea sp.]